jgi:dTDP-4-amino-4,6-dideoxygalactose transaminase
MADKKTQRITSRPTGGNDRFGNPNVFLCIFAPLRLCVEPPWIETTMTDEPIPYLDLAAQMRPLRAELDAAIGKTLDNCSFCLGPEVARFEREFAEFCGARHAVGFNSGTSALHVALLLLNIKADDEVITTPFTFVATSWAISYVGARPVYVDIEDATFNLDPTLVERAVTPRTKAILPVHLYGQPCDLDPLLAVCRKHGLPLVEDAAQAHGAKYRGRVVGTFGAVSCFSFYPGKNLGACGEGGALVTNDDALAARARSLREHGSTRRYYHDEIGFNYRMEGIQGAVLGVKLSRLREWTEARRRVARRYGELLAGTPLQLPVEAPGVESAWHVYVVRHPRRDELKARLEAARIGCALHYPVPLHLQKCYEFLGYKAGDFPVAEKAARECLSLPIYPELTEDQIQRVAATVGGFFAVPRSA